MTRHDKDVVAAFRDALAARIGRERFALWFGQRVQVQVAGSCLRVVATDRFRLERVKSQFRDDLLAVGAQLLRVPVELDFAVDGSLAESRSQASPPAPAVVPPSNPAVVSKVLPSPAAEPRRRNVELNDFVVGDGNRLAHTAAQSVLRRLGQVSPLFLHGPSGCGKSHLLSAIATTARHQHGVRRVVSLTAELFTSQFLEALRGSGLPSFRRKYREVELLLVDDVHFFCGKRATVVELQYTVETLLREGRQLVLSADRPPAELDGFSAELVARISGGLVCGIELPDEWTRLEIARRLAARTGHAVPENVLRFVAAEVAGDAWQLAGALNRLQAAGEALQRPVSLELAETALADIVRATRRVVRLPDIETAVCDVFGIDSQSLQSQRKSKLLSQPRMLAMWLARKYTRAAFSEIGDYFGGRSHSTVISAQKKVDDWLADSAAVQIAHGYCRIQDAVRRVEARLRAG